MKNIDLQKVTNLLLANKVVNGFDSKKYIDWAIKLLENGNNTESLYILAGLDGEDYSVINKYFEKALFELAVLPEKDNEKLIDMFVLEIAEKVIKGQITPEEGLINMVKVYGIDYQDKYTEFIYLSDAIYSIELGEQPYCFSDLDADKIDESIKKEFFIFYEAEKKGIYEDVKDYIYCKKCSSLQKPVLKKKRFKNIQYYACSNCKSDDISYNTSSICREKIIEFLKTN